MVRNTICDKSSSKASFGFPDILLEVKLWVALDLKCKVEKLDMQERKKPGNNKNQSLGALSSQTSGKEQLYRHVSRRRIAWHAGDQAFCCLCKQVLGSLASEWLRSHERPGDDSCFRKPAHRPWGGASHLSDLTLNGSIQQPKQRGHFQTFKRKLPDLRKKTSSL
eukprot:4692688-Amphidinium_carterae.1